MGRDTLSKELPVTVRGYTHEAHPKGKRWTERNREAERGHKMGRGIGWTWWHIPLNSGSWEVRQECQEFEHCLGYIAENDGLGVRHQSADLNSYFYASCNAQTILSD